MNFRLKTILKVLQKFPTGTMKKIKTILVAARSYAYFYSKPENRKFPGKSYDGSDNPDEFQKYLGYGYEKRSPNSSRLVEATNGQIITYNGESIKPWYFDESSGQTISAKDYCLNRVKMEPFQKPLSVRISHISRALLIQDESDIPKNDTESESAESERRTSPPISRLNTIKSSTTISMERK